MLIIKNLPRIILNLLFAFTQFFAPFFHEITGIGKKIEDVTSRGITYPEMPAGYAFSIWFVIFTLSIIYAIHQSLPSQRENKLYKKIGYYSAAAFLTSTLWMLIVQIKGDSWYLVALILLMLFFALKSFILVNAEENNSKFKNFVLMPLFGLFSGWLSIAFFLSITSFIRQSYSFNFPPTLYALFTIVPASILAFWIIFKTRGNLWYSGAIIWGLLAIIISNLILVHNTLIAALSGFLLLFITVVIFYINKQK